jgi:hypothetical protein
MRCLGDYYEKYNVDRFAVDNGDFLHEWYD